MESCKSLSRLFLLIGSYTFTTSNTCDIRTTNLHQEGYVSDIGSEYQPLLETINGASVTDCAIYVERKPSLQWFIFNSVDQVCITSTCWAMPVQLVPSSNNVLYRKASPTSPQSCSDVKETEPTATDGEYWIYPDAPTFLGCPTKIYCHDMASGPPKEYVSLTVTNTGEFPSVQNTFCSGETSYPGGFTYFSKIRVDIKMMAVNTADHTFATGNGYYGAASDCYSENNFDCGPKGIFSINTIGTGMIVDPQQQWTEGGYLPYTPSVTRSGDGVQIDLLCGGSCGGCAPNGPLKLHRNKQEDVPPENGMFVLRGDCCGQ
ncbi:A disintegrin and metalloproteinase with thrombospondin motifs 9-like [Haliotis cracherodii]|uniref:A disintegrin and metalloproteinase with thrombospondin motifs 9-like n=1 Tax=Haliotis cracherodii TaxID=6455 RepID=UPI0039E792B4